MSGPSEPVSAQDRHSSLPHDATKRHGFVSNAHSDWRDCQAAECLINMPPTLEAAWPFSVIAVVGCTKRSVDTPGEVNFRCHMRQFITAIGVMTVLMLSVQASQAEFSATFVEGAPKDRFVLKNETGCELRDGSITLDLRPTTAGLLFDTVPAGAGENVAQPFEIARAEGVNATVSNVRDGATVARLQFSRFASGGEIEVTVDVDDSVRSGPRGVQMIDASEIVGARVIVAHRSGVLGQANFDRQGQSRFELAGCSAS